MGEATLTVDFGWWMIWRILYIVDRILFVLSISLERIRGLTVLQCIIQLWFLNFNTVLEQSNRARLKFSWCWVLTFEHSISKMMESVARGCLFLILLRTLFVYNIFKRSFSHDYFILDYEYCILKPKYYHLNTANRWWWFFWVIKYNICDSMYNININS